MDSHGQNQKFKNVKSEDVQHSEDNTGMNLKTNNCKQIESLDSEITIKNICTISPEVAKENLPLINVSSDSRPFLRIKVGNNLNNGNLPSDVQIDFLVDSGAACSLLHLKDFEKLEVPHTAVDDNDNHQLVAANGTKLDISRKVFLNLTIGGKSILHPFYVCKSIKHSIIGWDAMKKYNIVLANGEFFVDNKASQKLNKTSRNNNVIAKRHYYTVKPGERKQILGHIKKPVGFKEGEPVLIEDVR